VTDWSSAMVAAIALAQSPDAPRGLNPRVGCVIVDAAGEIVGSGYHRGAGTNHAEVEALLAAGARAKGATAVVTLEPCRHTGRTGPCTEALTEAGISRVVFAQSDPTALAGGGSVELQAAGIEVLGGIGVEEASAINRGWTHVQRTGRPFVMLKMAVTLDGRVAGADGGPTAITGQEASAYVHRLRREVDAIMVGSGTAIIDDPLLTARFPDGSDAAAQPLRVVMGERELPPGLRLFAGGAPAVHLRTRNPLQALRELADLGVQRLLLEGGPVLAGAFLEAHLVDEVVWLVAPRLFGAGPSALTHLNESITVEVREVERIGDDVLIRGIIKHTGD
jgi:diaminohydroxyphosphoribosylaminopyrimidine deaminase/5-amino-6-(5-phosphoribosylamino)uracil reductase